MAAPRSSSRASASSRLVLWSKTSHSGTGASPRPSATCTDDGERKRNSKKENFCPPLTWVKKNQRTNPPALQKLFFFSLLPSPLFLCSCSKRNQSPTTGSSGRGRDGRLERSASGSHQSLGAGLQVREGRPGRRSPGHRQGKVGKIPSSTDGEKNISIFFKGLTCSCVERAEETKKKERGGRERQRTTHFFLFPVRRLFRRGKRANEKRALVFSLFFFFSFVYRSQSLAEMSTRTVMTTSCR